MTSEYSIQRKLIVFGIILPLAAVVGYLLASPDFGSLALVGMLLMVLSIPLVLRWHHLMLVFAWNAALNVFFLPGSPPLWMPLALVSLGLTILGRIMDKETKLIHVPAVTWSLLALALVVLITAKMTGGLGVRSMGSETYGGRKHFYILLAIVGFFALSTCRIPLAKANTHIGAFFLSGLTPGLSNLAYMAGPSLWFLFYFLPLDWAVSQVMEDFGANPFSIKFSRLGGMSLSGLAALSFMMIRYGIRGIFDLSKPVRLLVFAGILGLSLVSGFRSMVVMFVLMFGIQFLLEGLLRTRLFLVLILSSIMAFVGLLFFVQKLPLSVQRSLSVLPIEVHPLARADAQGTTEWRLRMWQVLLPEIPKHLLRGKGYTASGTDYYLATEAYRRGFSSDYELAILAGDYHNGPLSVLIPFGAPGALAFLAFIVASLRVFYLNYRYGDPALKHINTFLFSYFIARLIFFIGVFGAIHSDLAVFAGLIGMSISLNGGVARPKPATQPAALEEAIASPRSALLRA